MSLENFVPSIWSREIDVRLRKDLVAMELTNQDWEGEISEEGDVVKITRPNAISVGDYTKGQDITIETPTSDQKQLEIDQSRYFAFEVDDLDQVQANIDLIEPYTEEANFALMEDVDQFIMEKYVDADSSNVIGPTALDSTNIYDELTEAKKRLSENNVPKEGRWVAMSPEEIKLLETSDEFTDASDLGDETKRAGFAGRIAGFEVYESNNIVEESNVRHNLFGHTVAITFAMQVLNVEAQRMEKRFSDLVKGLVLYGALTLKTEALGDLQNDIS